MHIVRLFLVLCLAAASVVTAVPIASAAPMPLDECIGPQGFPVTTDVKLTVDLTCPGSSGIVVGADGITVDLGGHAVSGDQTANHYGVDNSAGFEHVTVKGGTIRKFEIGVFGNIGTYRAANSMTVEDIVASGNTSYGVNIAGDSAHVSSSEASGGGSVGIGISGDFARVRASDTSRNMIAGITIDGDHAGVSSSRASANGAYGMVIAGDAAKVTSTQAWGNGGDGIRIAGAAAHVTGSQASGNVGVGIHIFGVFARIRSSRASGNNTDGVDVSGDAAKIGQLRGGPVSDKNRADANGFVNGASNGFGQGYYVHDFSRDPIGHNFAAGNDDPAECNPTSLC